MYMLALRPWDIIILKSGKEYRGKSSTTKVGA